MNVENRGGRLIASVRGAAGLSQGQLAERTSQDIANMSNIENGKRYYDALPFDFFNRLVALPELKPMLSGLDLLRAWGYNVEVPDASFLPGELIEQLRKLTPAELRWIEETARGLSCLRSQAAG